MYNFFLSPHVSGFPIAMAGFENYLAVAWSCFMDVTNNTSTNFNRGKIKSILGILKILSELFSWRITYFTTLINIWIFVFFIGSPCEVSFEPVNGDFICTSDEAGVNCTLHCAEGYSFSEGSSENYYCAYDDGIWKPPFSPEWPSCSCESCCY